MMPFKKYNSIENTFDKGFVEEIVLEGIDKQEFVVQEILSASRVLRIRFVCRNQRERAIFNR
jgi:hypothetical protein